MRYGPPEGDLYLDIVTRLGEAFTWKDLDVESKTVENVNVRVVSPTTLCRMKKDTVRPLDHADAAALAREYDLTDKGKR